MIKLLRPIIFFDIETTGLDINTDRIVQLAMLKIHPDGNIEEKVSLINPLIEISVGAYEKHGINNDMVKDSPTFKQIAKPLNKYFEDCDLGGYNSNKFDIPILIKEFSRCNIEFDCINRKFIDIYTLETVISPKNLETIYEKYTNKKLENSHDAMVDIKATYTIFNEQLKIIGDEKSLNEINQLILDKTNKVDISNKLKLIDGVICWNFGKHFNEPIIKNLDYCNWFLKSDFPIDSKQIIKKTLKENIS